MKLSIGIVGLPNVGKSTLFKILTSRDVLIANYPFATIDPSVGIVEVEDERLRKLAEISKSKKTIPAVIEFFDIAGLVKGASRGEGLGNQFLSHIRETQAILIVLRVFKDSDIVHVEQTVDPMRDLEIINTELMLKDIETVDKRLGSLEKEAKSGDKTAVKSLEVLKNVREALSKNQPALRFVNEQIVRGLQLLTAKKQLYLLNGGKEEAGNEVIAKIREIGADFLIVNLSAAGSIPELSKKAYAALDLISFFTTGEDETRAWTIKRGAKAPEAAGVIHTDFEKNFIRAEVVNYEKLVQFGSWNEARQRGFIRFEGKDYVMEDGDVIVVRHG